MLFKHTSSAFFILVVLNFYWVDVDYAEIIHMTIIDLSFFSFDPDTVTR